MKLIYPEIVKTYRGWRKFENRRFADNFVNTKGSIKFNSHEEILNKLKQLLKNFSVKSEEDRFIEAKLIASIYLLRHKLEEKIDFFEYVKNTIGIKPKIIPESKIERLTKKIKNRLTKLGIKYTKKDIESHLYTKNFSKKEFSDKLEKEKNILISKAEKYLNLKLKEKIKLEFVNEDKYWKYYLNIKKKGFALKINTNPDRVKHKKGSLKYAIMHELCGHALQLGSWKEQIKKGKINEVCGCEEDYGPEIFMLEGVGESIFYYAFEDDLDEYLELELMFDELEHIVQNNAYIMVNTGKSLSESTKYYTDRVIKSNRKSVMKTLKEVRDDSFMRAYRPVYGLSLLFFKKVSQELNKKQKNKFFRQLYLKPMTYNQIKKLYLKIIKN